MKTVAKLVRLVLSLVLLCLLVVYTKNQYDVMKWDMMATSASEGERTEFEYPAISVCGFIGDPKEADQVTPWVVHASHDLIDQDGKDYILDSKPGDGLANVGGSEEWDNRIQFVIPTKTFYCNRYTPPSGKTTAANGLKKLELHLNSSNLIPSMGGFFISANYKGGINAFTLFGNSRVAIEAARHDVNGKVIVAKATINIEFGLWSRLPTDERPCDNSWSTKSKEMETCVDDYISARSPCFGAGGRSASTCSQEELWDAVGMFGKISSAGESNFINVTGCRPPCTTHTYDLDLVSLHRPDGFGSDRGGDTVVSVLAPHGRLTYRRDFQAYSPSAMAGDVGGMAGIFLGFSALSLYDVIIDGINYVWKFGKKRRPQNRKLLGSESCSSTSSSSTPSLIVSV